MYRVVRVYKDRDFLRVIRKNLTLEEAQAHCRDPETSSRTCKERRNAQRTSCMGKWVDCYEEQ